MKRGNIKRSALIAVCALLLLFLWRCPVRFFFGVSCPGCGMTRALFSALKMDFLSAFAYHPLWLLLPAGAVLLLYRTIRLRSLSAAAKSLERAAVVGALLMIVVYILRLILKDPVVMPDLSAGLAERIISNFI